VSQDDSSSVSQDRGESEFPKMAVRLFPRMGVTQIPTLAKWGPYLEQCVTLQFSSLGEQLAAVIGPLEFNSGEVDVPDSGWTLVHIK
jgi:hypothetical protein